MFPAPWPVKGRVEEVRSERTMRVSNLSHLVTPGMSILLRTRSDRAQMYTANIAEVDARNLLLTLDGKLRPYQPGGDDDGGNEAERGNGGDGYDDGDRDGDPHDAAAGRYVGAGAGAATGLHGTMAAGVPRLSQCVGWMFLVCNRRPQPESEEQWTAPDVYEMIESLADLLGSSDLMVNADMQRLALSPGGLVLTAESSMEDVSAAWTQMKAVVVRIGERARLLGVTGNATQHQQNMTKRVNGVMTIMSAIYKKLHGDAHFRSVLGMHGGDAVTASNDDMLAALEDGGGGADAGGGARGKAPGGAKDGESKYSVMIEFLMRCISEASLRKVKDIVYGQVYAPAYTWAPPPRNPVCVEAGCRARAAYGQVPLDAGGWPLTDDEDDEDDGMRGDDGGDVPYVIRARQWCSVHAARYRALPDGGDGSGVAVSEVAAGHVVVDLRLNADGVLRESERGEKFSAPTQTWQPLMNARRTETITIKQWVVSMFPPDGPPGSAERERWLMFVNQFVGNLQHCSTWLAMDGAFKEYTPDHHFIAFCNGIYDLQSNVFSSYGLDAMPDVCCLNYVNQTFHPWWCCASLNGQRMTVPGADTIFARQGIVGEEAMVVYAFIGRLFFEVGERDNYQRLLVFIGYAATGKTSLLRAIAELVGVHNMAYIASNCEEKYALAHATRARIWACPEMRAPFHLPASTLLSMVDGCGVTVNEKHVTARDIVAWRSHGVMVGNEIPQELCSDSGGAMARRMLVVNMESHPGEPDAAISQRTLSGAAWLLAKSIRAYLRFLRIVSALDNRVERAMPLRFRKTAEEFRANSNPVLTFLREATDQVELADISMRQALLRFLVERVRVAPEVLNVSEEEVRAFPDALLHRDDAAAIVNAWCAPETALQKCYMQFWQSRNQRPRKTMASNDIARPAARELCVAMLDGMTQQVVLGGRAVAVKMWFGVRVRHVADGGEAAAGASAGASGGASAGGGGGGHGHGHYNL